MLVTVALRNQYRKGEKRNHEKKTKQNALPAAAACRVQAMDGEDGSRAERGGGLLMPHPHDWRDAEARCPFYRSVGEGEHRGRMLSCAEGPVERSRVTLLFQRGDAFERYFTRFCCGAYEHCPICRVILESRYASRG